MLDARGRERLFLMEGFDPAALSAYLRALLAEPGTAPAAPAAPPPPAPMPSRPSMETAAVRSNGSPVELLRSVEEVQRKEVAALKAMVELLIEKGYDPQYGARPMRRAVERYLEDPFAEELLRGNVKAGDVVHVAAANGRLVFNVAEAQSATAGAS